MAFIELDGAFFNVDMIAMIRPADLGTDAKRTSIYTSGQNPTDGGFTVNLSVEEVLEKVQQARLIEMEEMLDAAERGESEVKP